MECSGRLLGRRHHVHAGRDLVFTLTRREYGRAEQEAADHGAAAIGSDGARTLWMTPEGFFWEDEGLDREAVSLLAWDRARRRDSRLDRLRNTRARAADLDRARRERIPPAVRAFVWERDEGACVGCGAQEDLQFDHVIPVARGGGNAPDNLQVLCGDCNRRKSDAIAGP